MRILQNASESFRIIHLTTTCRKSYTTRRAHIYSFPRPLILAIARLVYSSLSHIPLFPLYRCETAPREATCPSVCLYTTHMPLRSLRSQTQLRFQSKHVLRIPNNVKAATFTMNTALKRQ